MNMLFLPPSLASADASRGDKTCKVGTAFTDGEQCINQAGNEWKVMVIIDDDDDDDDDGDGDGDGEWWMMNDDREDLDEDDSVQFHIKTWTMRPHPKLFVWYCSLVEVL